MDYTTREAFAVREFCAHYGICRQTFYDEVTRQSATGSIAEARRLTESIRNPAAESSSLNSGDVPWPSFDFASGWFPPAQNRRPHFSRFVELSFTPS
jgi:hypothetical protein